MVIFVLLHLFNALCFRAKKIVGSPPVLPLASLLNVKAAVVLGRSKREIPIQQSMTQSLKLLFHTDVLMTFEIKKRAKGYDFRQCTLQLQGKKWLQRSLSIPGNGSLAHGISQRTLSSAQASGAVPAPLTEVIHPALS